MGMLSLSNVLEYLYDKFILTFILCLIGAIIREMMNTVKLLSIDIKRMMASVVMASALMCIVVDYVHFQFSIYIVICIVAGVWSPYIMEMVLDSKFMGKLVRGILSGMKGPITKEVAKAMSEMDDEEKSINTKDKPKNTSDEINET